MKKFGLGRKGDGDEDSGRLALFGSRSKSKSPAPTPPSQNPYAQPAVPPDPYTQAKINAGILPRPEVAQAPFADPGRGGQPPNDGYGAPMRGHPRGMDQQDIRQGSYGPDSRPGGLQGGYGGNNKYSASQGGYGGNGYGSDRYGGQNQTNPASNPYNTISQTSGTSRYGAGGYGGLGRSNSNETTATDDNREALFGGARDRLQQKKQAGYGGGSDNGYNSAEGGQGGQGSYGGYGDRQLTAEDEEEEDVQAVKQDIRFMKQQDVASTRNALRIAAQAEETGRNTLASLGAQGERIHNTERNLDIAANHNRDAEDKARELKTINRSMWAVHVNNPFTGKERREKRDEEIMRKHHEEREQREATRGAAFQSDQRMQQRFRGLERDPAASASKSSLAERAKYQFEADSEDDEMENEIDANLDALSGVASRLNILARATGEEVETQNRHLERIGVKSDRVDDQLHMNTERLRRIR